MGNFFFWQLMKWNICGDFNSVQDIHFDYQNYKSTNKNIKARKYIIDEVDKIYIGDTFRFVNGSAKIYMEAQEYCTTDKSRFVFL